MASNITYIFRKWTVVLALVPILAFTSFAQTSPGKEESAIVQIVSKYDAREYPMAAAMCRALLEKAPDNDAAHFYLGMSFIALGDNDSAETHLSRAAELDPTNYWYRYRLAQFYAYTSRPELTTAMYESLLKDFPKETDLYYELIELYVSQGRRDDAITVIDKIETLYGRTESSVRARYTILAREDRAEEALDMVREEAAAGSPWALTVLGDNEAMAYRDSSAIAYYNEALSVEPGYPIALLGRAEIYRMTRRYALFFEDLDAFVKMDEISPLGKSEYMKNIIKAADGHMVRNYRKEFDGVISDFLETHPSDSLSLVTAGLYYYKVDDKEKAEEVMRKNAETYPESISAAASYIEILYYLEDWEKLIETSLGFYEKFPDEVAFLEYAIMGSYRIDDYDRILETADRILKDFKGEKDKCVSAYSTIGDVNFQKGENTKAYKAYKKALKLDSDYVPVLNNYAYYLSLDGKKLSKAAAMSRKTIDAEPDNPTYLDTYGWILHLQKKDSEAKPYFKHAMLYGGKESATILDHYAEVLYSLGEYDQAYVYWYQCKLKNASGEVPDLEEKVAARKAAAKK